MRCAATLLFALSLTGCAGIETLTGEPLSHTIAGTVSSMDVESSTVRTPRGTYDIHSTCIGGNCDATINKR